MGIRPDDPIPGRADVLRMSPPMFSSRLLDSLTRTRPRTLVLLYAPLILGMAGLALARLGILAAAVLAVAGYVLWTLTEYWLHRLVFHFTPRGPIGYRLHWTVHGVHHDHPNDPQRLLMPPVVGVPAGLLCWGLLWFVLPGQWWIPVAAGWASGYLAYDLLHYHLHHGRSAARLIRWLRAWHLRHHFQNDGAGFGVSAPYWDYVFGTRHTGRR